MFHKDLDRFIYLFSQLTHIDKDRLRVYLIDKGHDVSYLLQRPTDIAGDLSELQAIEDFRELKNLYCSLRDYGLDKILNSPELVAEYFVAKFKDIQEKEYFHVLFLDTKFRPIDLLSYPGTVDTAHLYPREIFKEALLKNAKAIILCHNHPTGVPQPSSDDIDLTRRMYKAGDALGISVLDHFIIANNDYLSLKNLLGNDFGAAVRDRQSEYKTSPLKHLHDDVAR